ncbi:MAG TPA: T9SS type A sorting domain-containing protein [Bacteroidales bacterium]
MNKLFLSLLMFISYSPIAQNIWEPINFPDTLRTKAINAEKENTLFVAVGGNNDFTGLFRSFNDGGSWEQLYVDSIYYINIFSIKYSNDGVLFVSSGSGIFRSFDDGDTFEKSHNITRNILNICVSPSNEIYAIGWGIILRSSNNGNAWDTLSIQGGNIYFTDLDFGLNGEIYVVGGSYDGPNTGSGFHRSLDHGLTWESIGITDIHLHTIEVNDVGIIIVGSEENAAVFSSSDNGENFSIISDLLITAMASDSQDNLIAGVNGYDYNGCRFSEDWGYNWSILNDSILNPYINQISISPDNTVYLQCKKLTSQPYQLYKSINPLVNVNNKISHSEIRIYPNPSNDKIKINNIPTGKKINYNIYNLKGQRVLAGVCPNNEINISNLIPAIYIIELEMDNKIIREKIIKE